MKAIPDYQEGDSSEPFESECRAQSSSYGQSSETAWCDVWDSEEEEEEENASFSTSKSGEIELKENLDEDPVLSVKTMKTQDRIEKYTRIRLLGEGTFGQVFLVKDNIEKLFAMKVLSKRDTEGEWLHQAISIEKEILSGNQHPNLVSLHEIFEDEEAVYFVLEYCSGGELFSHLQQGKFEEEKAKFYAANVVLALEFLHKNGIVYRDLKPENVLIGADGYAKVTDFGLSKKLQTEDEKAYSFCGTVEYLAPEIVCKMPYGKEVDWWTLGNLLFEMTTSHTPFFDENRYVLYKAIQFEDPYIPEFLSPELQDLINKLLIKNPSKRLGSNSGVQEIKSHPWFNSINWEDLETKKVSPPFLPISFRSLEAHSSSQINHPQDV